MGEAHLHRAVNSGCPEPVSKWAELETLRTSLRRLRAAPRPMGDAAVGETIARLREQGAARIAHSGGRPFLDHLTGTWRILTLWGQPRAVCRAGLLHSCYGTGYFTERLFDLGQRHEVRALVGAEAERLAFLFCGLDRRSLREVVDGGLRDRPLRVVSGGSSQTVSPATVGRLAVLDLANRAEQSGEGASMPGLWMARHHAWSGLLRDAGLRDVPQPGNGTPLSSERESAARDSYVRATASDCPDRARPGLLRTACELNPGLAEPRVLLSLRALERGRWSEAWQSADAAVVLLLQWGTAWDKRLSWQTWLAKVLTARGVAASRMKGPSPDATRDIEVAQSLIG